MPVADYVRVSRNCIVNLSFVVEVKNTNSRRKMLVLKDGKTVNVSCRRWGEVKSKLSV